MMSEIRIDYTKLPVSVKIKGIKGDIVEYVLKPAKNKLGAMLNKKDECQKLSKK